MPRATCRIWWPCTPFQRRLSPTGGQITADQFIDVSGLSSIADFIPSVLDNVKINGKLYYVPVSTNALGVLYNKKIFSDNSLTVPTDINAFTTLCDTLKSKNITPMAGGFKDSWVTQLIPFIAFSQYIDGKDGAIKGKLAAGAMKYADLGQPLTDVLSLQQTWAKAGYFQPSYMGTDVNTASSMLGAGKAAMMINGTWQLTAVLTANADAQIGYFPLPLNQPGEKIQIPTSADSGMCINAASKNLDAAKQALDYYLSADNQLRVMKDLNSISTNTKVKLDNAFISDVMTAMSSANCNVQPTWWGTGGYYWPTPTTFQIDVQLQNLLAVGTAIDQFISDADAAVARVLASASNT